MSRSPVAWRAGRPVRLSMLMAPGIWPAWYSWSHVDQGDLAGFARRSSPHGDRILRRITACGRDRHARRCSSATTCTSANSLATSSPQQSGSNRRVPAARPARLQRLHLRRCRGLLIPGRRDCLPRAHSWASKPGFAIAAYWPALPTRATGPAFYDLTVQPFGHLGKSNSMLIGIVIICGGCPARTGSSDADEQLQLPLKRRQKRTKTRCA